MKKIRDLFNQLVNRKPKFKPVLIETPRLILREIKPEDTQRFFEITTAPGFIYCYFDGTKESVVKFVNKAIDAQNPANKKRTEYLLAVVEKNTGELIGHVSIENENLVKDYSCSVNFFVDPKYQSKGYGREAGVNIMRYALEDLSLPGFSVTIHPDNKPSLKVATNEGYKEIGKTTLETSRGIEPRLLLILTKDDFYAQRKNDKVAYMLPKKPVNDNSGWFSRKKKTP